MAEGAAGGKPSRDVVRIRRPGKVLRVTSVAVSRQRSEVVVRVALRATYGRMRAGQREGRRMIERRWRPGACRMA